MSEKYADSENSPPQSQDTFIETTDSEDTFVEIDNSKDEEENVAVSSSGQQSTMIENEETSEYKPSVSSLPQKTIIESDLSDQHFTHKPPQRSTSQKTIVEVENPFDEQQENQTSVSSLPQETILESDLSQDFGGKPPPFSEVQKTMVESDYEHTQQRRKFKRPSRKKLDAPFVGITCGTNNRYQVVQLLQQGGMGQVYIAVTETPEHYYKLVAIKFLKKEFLLADNREEIEHRFNREIRILMSLNHPNIVSIIDQGFYPLEEDNQIHNIPFYVMEYLKGQSLTKYLEGKGPLTIEEAMPLMLQISTGLSKAHQNNIIHRDLKPDNIFLIPTTKNRYIIKILDFGIAKNLESISAVKLTNVADYFASPYYISPEHINGITALGPWSDIYTLGLIFYEMLSGNKPFDHDENLLQTRGWPGIHNSKKPHELISQPGCENIPTTLNNIIMKCLSKEPSRRFANAQELLNALSSFSAQISSIPKTSSPELPTTPIRTPVKKSTSKNSSFSQQLLLITFGLILGISIGILIGIFIYSKLDSKTSQNSNNLPLYSNLLT